MLKPPVVEDVEKKALELESELEQLRRQNEALREKELLYNALVETAPT